MTQELVAGANTIRSVQTSIENVSRTNHGYEREDFGRITLVKFEIKLSCLTTRIR